jgi:hypothetical protein
MRGATYLLGAWMLTALAGVTQVELKKETADAFDSYIRATESRLQVQIRGGSFLWVDGAPERKQRVHMGLVISEPLIGKGDREIPDGLIHDWIGAVFIPGATLAATLRLVEDYDNHKRIYQPEVIDSKLLSRDGNDYKIFMRLLKKKILTVVLNTYHDVHYTQLDEKRWYSRSSSTRIAEVERGRELPPGQDHGFLWRLNSYWRFEERDGGVYVECEAISLTRNVPLGFGWLVNPIIRSLPQESLASTLRATRDTLQASRTE